MIERKAAILRWQRHGALFQRQPDERQPQRRVDRSRPQEREPPQLHLRCGLYAGRPDQEGSSGSLARSASGATSGRRPTSSTTPRSTRRSTRRTLRGRRSRRSGTVESHPRDVAGDEKNKFNFFADPQRDCHCPALTASGSVNAPEAFSATSSSRPDSIRSPGARVDQQASARSGLRACRRQLADLPAAGSHARRHIDRGAVDRHAIQLGHPTFRSALLHAQLVPRFSQRVSASYVTGGHNFKAGAQFEESYLEIEAENGTHSGCVQPPGAGQPHAVGDAIRLKAQNKDFGFYAQDQWTMRRLTLTYGVRYEYFNGYVPPQHVNATPTGGCGAQLRRGQERPALEGRRSANRRRLRPLRERQDGAEGGARALRGKTAIAITQNNNPVQTSINSVTRTGTTTPIRWAIRAVVITSLTAIWPTAP